MKLNELKRFDAAEHIQDDQDVIYFLEAAFEDETIEDLARALETVIRAKGQMTLAQQLGMGRDELNDILNPRGSPKRDELMKIYVALGVDPNKKADAAE